MNRKQKRVLRQLWEFIYYGIKYASLTIVIYTCLIGVILAYIYGMFYFVEEGKPEAALRLSNMLRYGVNGAIIYAFLSWIEFMAKNGVCKRQKDI